MVRKPPARTSATDDAVTPPDAANAIEAQLARLEGQLDQLKAQVRQAQQLAGLGTAATMIAHEVNNLLTPIRSYAQYALDTDDRELQRKALKVTLRNVHILVAMSDRLLKISAAKPAAREAVVVRTVVQDAYDGLCRDLSKDGIGFSVEVAESLTAWVDPLQLQQVLFNLFLNARNAMADSHGGKLTVSAGREGDRVALEVKDTGNGIPPDLLSRLFEPLQTSKPMASIGGQRCAGLGLALCRDLVEENGGTITVTSKPGAGTTFRIILPTRKAPGK